MCNIGKTIIFMLFFLAILLTTSCSRKPGSETGVAPQMMEQEPRIIAVEGVVVDRGGLVEVIRSAGVVEGVREAWIISETEGLVQKSHFRLGDNVQAGETLLTVENTLASQNRELADGQYRTALLEYQAAKRSQENGSISALQFSQTYDRLLATKTALSTAEDAYENTYIKAPFSGSIASRNRELSTGNYISRGARVAHIVDYAAYQTEISIGEGMILMVEKEAKVSILGNDDIPRIGRVSAISAGSNDRTGSFTVVVEWEPLKDDRLKSGMSVDVAIEAMNGTRHIIAPSSATFVRGGEVFVYVDVENTAELRRIAIGNRLGERIEVLAGIESGDVLITSGLASLNPGAKIITTIVNSKSND